MSFTAALGACECLTTTVIRLHGSKQACYGHTEGAAGLAGAMTAAALCCSALAPPLTTLRQLNPYTATAASDWQARQGMQAEIPRQIASCPALVRLMHLRAFADGKGTQAPTSGRPQGDSTHAAGTSSFGMSGVNAHGLFGAPRVLTSVHASQVGFTECHHTTKDSKSGWHFPILSLHGYQRYTFMAHWTCRRRFGGGSGCEQRH